MWPSDHRARGPLRGRAPPDPPHFPGEEREMQGPECSWGPTQMSQVKVPLSAPTRTCSPVAPRLVLWTLLQKPQLPSCTSPAPAPLRCGSQRRAVGSRSWSCAAPRDHRMETEAGLAGWGVTGSEQVGKRLHPGCGVSSVPYLFIYLFFRRFLGGVGRRGWEEGVGGWREREGREAGSERDR